MTIIPKTPGTAALIPATKKSTIPKKTPPKVAVVNRLVSSLRAWAALRFWANCSLRLRVGASGFFEPLDLFSWVLPFERVGD